MAAAARGARAAIDGVIFHTADLVYCIDGANRPTHEGAVATVEALDS